MHFRAEKGLFFSKIEGFTVNNPKSSSSDVRFETVSADFAGQRIDNYLLRVLKGVPRSRIYRILRKGEVRVNKGRVKPEYRLVEGDELRIPPLRMAEREQGVISPGFLETLKSAIIFETDRFIVVNKPAGMAVHGGSGIRHGVIEALRFLRPDDKALELVHRLDRDTSGCLVIAKKRSALRRAHELLREGRVDKRYLALVRGHWDLGRKRLDLPLKTWSRQGGERTVAVDADGKSAVSIFRPVTMTRKASLLEVKIETGRTHQIRVHASYSGHPVAGDTKYGDEGFNQDMRRLGLNRMFLHASSIGFDDDEMPLHVDCPLDEALGNVLESL